MFRARNISRTVRSIKAKLRVIFIFRTQRPAQVFAKPEAQPRPGQDHGAPLAGLAVGGSFGSFAKGIVAGLGVATFGAAITSANAAEATAFGIDQGITIANNITDLTIIGWEQSFQAREAIRE